MVGDFVHVVDGADDLGADRSAVVEALELAPGAAVGALDQPGLCGVGVLDGVRVDPLLDLYAAGAVVEPVGGVGGLSGDVTYLADKGEVRDGAAVDLELVVAARLLLGVEELLDRDGPQRVLGVFASAARALLARSCVAGDEAAAASTAAGAIRRIRGFVRVVTWCGVRRGSCDAVLVSLTHAAVVDSRACVPVPGKELGESRVEDA